MIEKSRLLYLDTARFIAIFFMVLSHVQAFYATRDFSHSLVGASFDLLAGPPAAPVFMFSMGFLMLYNRSPKQVNAMRGLKILVAGIALNIARFVLPFLIAVAFQKEIPLEILTAQPVGLTVLYLTFHIDILLLAGVSYFLVAVIFKKEKLFIPVILFFAIAFISPHLWGIYSGNIAADLFLNLLWGTTAHVSFPLFPWLCFTFLGAWVGNRYFSANKMHGKPLFFVGLFLFVLGLIITAVDIDGQIGDYYRSGPGAVFLYSGFVVIWILILKQIEALPQKMEAIIEYISRNLTSIYCIHWTVLGWLLLLIPLNSLGFDLFFLFFALVFMVSAIIAKYVRIKL